MITLNDYLYNGNTVPRLLHNFYVDMRNVAMSSGSPMDDAHCSLIMQQIEILEHNDFLSSQSKRLREFYKEMARRYPALSFTFKGRIKSVIRTESKFNGYIVNKVSSYYKKNGAFPDEEELANKVKTFRDLVAYRIIISMPKHNFNNDFEKQAMELRLLYEIANIFPDFVRQYDFEPQESELDEGEPSKYLNDDVKKYYKDYVANPSKFGYQSLHITLYDKLSKYHIEVQIRTKEMDDYSEIGPANHLGYEKRQENERATRNKIPKGVCKYFDEAYERGVMLQNIDLSQIDVDMFGAINNNLINDCCGLFRGRLIRPYEHLSRFQNDLID